MKNLNVVALVLALLQLFITNVAAHNDGGYMWGTGVGGLIALIVFILDIIAIVEVLGTDRGMGEKLCWILLILFFPLLGLILYCIVGKRGDYHAHGHSHGHHGYTQVV